MRKRWKGLYDTFKKNLSTYRNKKSGSAAQKKPKWQYFDMMSFLTEVDLSYNKYVLYIILHYYLTNYLHSSYIISFYF